MSGTACDVKAGTKEAIANLDPVHSETMCILPLTRCAEDAFTDALHEFSKRSRGHLSVIFYKSVWGLRWNHFVREK